MLDSVIFGLATGKIDGALTIIRVSGKNCFKLLKLISKVKSQNLTSNQNIIYNVVCFKKTNIDEVVFLTYKKNHSYTGEESFEIICHANKIIVLEIEALLISIGARQALPGEFTKRAFLNGKISLNKAESVNELINAKTRIAKNILLKNIFDQSETKRLQEVKDRLETVIGNIHVNVDYSENYELPVISADNVFAEIKNVLKIIKQMLDDFKVYQVNKNEPRIVICGLPNSGKSTLFNTLIHQDKAIVSSIAGTTRDFLEKEVSVKEKLFLLVDTAGINNTTDTIEKIGIKKTYQEIEQADLVIYLVDAVVGLNKEDDKNLSKLKKFNKEVIIAWNKADLVKEINNPKNSISVSAKNKQVASLINGIEAKFKNKQTDGNYTIINAEKIHLIKKFFKILKASAIELKANQHVDVVNYKLEKSYEILLKILNIDYDLELIDNIFKKFCVGK